MEYAHSEKKIHTYPELEGMIDTIKTQAEIENSIIFVKTTAKCGKSTLLHILEDYGTFNIIRLLDTKKVKTNNWFENIFANNSPTGQAEDFLNKINTDSKTQKQLICIELRNKLDEASSNNLINLVNAANHIGSSISILILSDRSTPPIEAIADINLIHPKLTKIEQISNYVSETLPTFSINKNKVVLKELLSASDYNFGIFKKNLHHIKVLVTKNQKLTSAEIKSVLQFLSGARAEVPQQNEKTKTTKTDRHSQNETRSQNKEEKKQGKFLSSIIKGEKAS